MATVCLLNEFISSHVNFPVVTLGFVFMCVFLCVSLISKKLKFVVLRASLILDKTRCFWGKQWQICLNKKIKNNDNNEKNVRNLHTRQTKSSFARFARAFFIFVYFIAVLVLSATCVLFKTFVQLFIFDYLETAHTNLFPG